MNCSCQDEVVGGPLACQCCAKTGNVSQDVGDNEKTRENGNMREIKMTKERREETRKWAESVHACGADKTGEMLFDALDTIDALEAENAALRAELDALRGKGETAVNGRV